MRLEVKITKRYNQMEQVEIRMRNGLHIQPFMDGMFKQFGHHFLVVVTLMQLIDHAKGILSLQQMIIRVLRYSDILQL